MIRTSKHILKFSNSKKKSFLLELLTEYRRVGTLIIDEIWQNGYNEFNIKQDKLNLDRFLDYREFSIDTKLSARILRSLVDQIRGYICAATEKRRRLLWLQEKLASEGKCIKKLSKKLSQLKVVKPNFVNAKLELNSNNIDFQQGVLFDYFIRLKSLGIYKSIRLPIKHTKVSLKWLKKGKLLNGLLIDEQNVYLRFKVENKTKESGIIVGADQGQKDILTFSNGAKTPKIDKHGHSLGSIINKMARKKKGSKAFKRVQSHRKNFVNWSINQLNFVGVREIRLEKIWNIRYKKRCSRKMSHWSNPEIRDKLKAKAEEQEVLVTEQSSTYRSQRCCNCGLVRKANRKGKLYSCKSCGAQSDADWNAAKNHEYDLPEISWSLRSLRKNLDPGFLWLESGIFNVDGSELTVSDSKK